MLSDKKNSLIVMIQLCAIILIFTLADLIQDDRLFSDTENRILTQRPEFTWERFLDGSFGKEYEDYVTDQFVGRNKWIRMKTSYDLLMNKQEINGVYLGKDNYLIEQHLPESFSEKRIEKSIRDLRLLVNRYQARVMLVPTADTILTDKLPLNAPCFDQRSLLERVCNSIGAENFIDVYNPLRLRMDEEIFYRTDHHWTSLGAYYGYLAWADAMGVSPRVYETRVTASDKFLGTLYRKINRKTKYDRIFFYQETALAPVSVTFDFTIKSDTVYEEKWLETENQYGFFLDENHAFVEIETGNQTNRELFVIKDSFANCFVPLLLPHYDKIYMLDLRYYNGRLFDLLDRYWISENTDMIILYNCIHFLESFVYSK